MARIHPRPKSKPPRSKTARAPRRGSSAAAQAPHRGAERQSGERRSPERRTAGQPSADRPSVERRPQKRPSGERRLPEHRSTKRNAAGSGPNTGVAAAAAAAVTVTATATDTRAHRWRRLALELWGRIHIDWGYAATRLAAAVRQERWLTSTERRELLELLFGMIRQSRRLDFAIETSGARLPPGTQRDLARYLAFRVLSGAMSVAEARDALPEVDWQKVATVDARIPHERDAFRRLGLRYSLPDWLAARLLDEYPGEAEALASALNERAPLTLRVNTQKTTRAALLARFASEGIDATAGVLAPHAITLASRVDVFGLAAYAEGLFEVQDEGSQLIVEAVAVQPHSIVVDACAGAGGKTLALSAAMHDKGRLLALDIDKRKLYELQKRARHAGLSSVQALHTAPDAWPRDVAIQAGKVDRVLVDAACTGIGALRRNPEVRWRLDEGDVADLALRQEVLTARAATLLAPQGRLIYATCSLLRAENESVVERVLGRVPNLALERVADVLGPELGPRVCDASGTFLKTSPHRHGTDGFFAAVFRRRTG